MKEKMTVDMEKKGYMSFLQKPIQNLKLHSQTNAEPVSSYSCLVNRVACQ